MAKNIEINIKNSTGYEVLYPNVQASNVINFSSSNSLLNSSTASLFNLGSGSTPDQVFQILSKAALVNQNGLSSVIGTQIKLVNYEMVQYYGTGDSKVAFTVNHRPIFGVILAPTAEYVPQITGIFILDSVYDTNYYWIVISMGSGVGSAMGYEMRLNRSNGTMSFTSKSSGTTAMYSLNRNGTKYLVFYLWEEDL